MSRPKFFGEGLPYMDMKGWTGSLIAIEGCDGVGRTTQVALLREWLELQGFGVVETEWTQDNLIGEGNGGLQVGRPIDPLTYSLLWATDFADCLEKRVIPALRTGFVVLADRYVYTAFARAVARGADEQWVREMYGFAPVPDVVLYLQADVNTLIRRVLDKGQIGDAEAGLELRLGEDRYECFKRYQTRLIREFNRLAGEFAFSTVSARRTVEQTQKEIRQVMARFVERMQGQKAAKESKAAAEASAKRRARGVQKKPAS